MGDWFGNCPRSSLLRTRRPALTRLKRTHARFVMAGKTILSPSIFVPNWRRTCADWESTTTSSLIHRHPFRLWGFIGAPGRLAVHARGPTSVRQPPAGGKSRTQLALLEGYHTALMKGRYPVCCLFLEIDPAGVDVNIHPAKREVKFHSEREVRRLVAQAVRETLLQFHAKGPAPEEKKPDESVESPSPPVPQQPELTPPLPTLAPASIPAQLGTRMPAQPPRQPTPLPPVSVADQSKGDRAPEPAPATTATIPPPELATSTEELAAPSPPSAVSNLPAQPLLNIPLRLVGVVGRLYVVLESDRGLVLLDQHAAHERILFEQMLERLQQGAAPSQRLLLPETMELSARDAQFVRELLPTLTRLGIGISEFGERTFLLDALPPLVHVQHPRHFVLEVIDELKASGESVNSLRLGEHTVAKTVCRHAVKANDPLSGPELENLINDLRRCAMPYTCPHGRPTMIEMNYRELEKKFGRVT